MLSSFRSLKDFNEEDRRARLRVARRKAYGAHFRLPLCVAAIRPLPSHQGQDKLKLSAATFFGSEYVNGPDWAMFVLYYDILAPYYPILPSFSE